MNGGDNGNQIGRIRRRKLQLRGHAHHHSGVFLLLFAYKWMQFCLNSLHLTALYPARTEKSDHKLPKKERGRAIVSANIDLRRKTARALSNKRACSQNRLYGAHEFIRELPTVSAKSCSQVNKIHILEGCRQPCSLQKVFLGNGSRARMIRDLLCLLPRSDHKQAGADFGFMEQQSNLESSPKT